MKKAFAYLRVSSQGQVDGHGLERQRKAIRTYAQAHGYQIVQTYREEGVSGTLEDRPALADMLVSLEQNDHGVKTVLIEKLDRLARDLMVQEAIIRDFQAMGFSLVSTTEGPDLCADDPTRKLIRQVFGAIAEYDKSMLVQKLRAARERKRAREGKCEGRKGYRDSEAGRSIIAKARALRRKPKYGRQRSYVQVSKELNRQGVQTMTGKPWTGPMVQKLLK